MAFDGTNYLVVWSKDTQVNANDVVLDWTLYGRIVSPSGGLSGETFLVINDTGTVGYHTGDDLVIRVEGTTGTLTTADFTST